MGLSHADLRRIAWTFVMAAGGVFVALLGEWFTNGGELNWKVWAIAAVAAGISAVKNLALPDSSPAK